jgi:hypothetical protein
MAGFLLLEQLLGSKVAVGTTFRGCFWKAVTSFLKRLTGGIFTIIMLFNGSKLKLYFEFSAQKIAKSCEEHQRSSRSTVFIQRIHLITLSL